MVLTLLVLTQKIYDEVGVKSMVMILQKMGEMKETVKMEHSDLLVLLLLLVPTLVKRNLLIYD